MHVYPVNLLSLSPLSLFKSSGRELWKKGPSLQQVKKIICVVQVKCLVNLVSGYIELF